MIIIDFIFSCLLIVTAMIILESRMGRKLGKLELFSTNSHGIIDIYTVSHIAHGFLFYLLFMPFCSFLWVILLSVVLECIWEVFENTPYTINRYRKTISVDYEGDTIINSISDVIAMLTGIILASFMPIWGIVVLIIGLELLGLILVRDNLTLNIIMLIYPFEYIKRWQKGGKK